MQPSLSSPLARRAPAVGVLFALALSLPFVGGAEAQQAFMDYNDPNVVIDLSVIDDRGYGAPDTAMPYGPNGRKLLIPDGSNPVSMLHVAPLFGAMAEPAPKPREETAAKPVKKAEAPAPAPLAAAEPAPAPPPKKAEAPAPPTKLTQTEAPAAPSVGKAPEAAAPPAVPVAEAPKSPDVASLPPSGKLDTGLAQRVEFEGNATKLPDQAKDALIMLANKIKNEDALRLQLMAYAGGEGLSSSLARRMSLSRALSIRSFLIENGVRSTRIDVRALGNKTNEEPINRVDLTIAER